MPSKQAPPPKIEERVFVANGLQDQDENIDRLEAFFKEMQKATVETAQPDDFLSFASCAHFFGVIMLETITTAAPIPLEDESDEDDEMDNDAEGEPEEESEDVESAYPASSRPTSPPRSSISSPRDNHEASGPVQGSSTEASSTNRLDDPDLDLSTLSEQEKVLLWREAFMAQIEEDANDPKPLIPEEDPDDNCIPIYSNKGKFPEIHSPLSPLSPCPFLIPHTPDRGFFAQNDHSANMMDIVSESDNADFINWPDEGPAGHGRQMPAQPQQGSPTCDREPLDYGLDWYGQIRTRDEDNEFGREYLEPEEYTAPAPKLPEIPVDPQVQQMIYDSAIRFQDQLRMKRIREYQETKRRKAKQRNRRAINRHLKTTCGPKKTLQPIGLIYLWTSQTFLDFLHMGECSMGVYVTEEHRHSDLLVNVINQVVEVAFKDPDCHRIQSIIVENPDKLYTLEVLARGGFRNEGVRRRAFYSPLANEWKDVTYFAMLATEWALDNTNPKGPRKARLRTDSLWDEVFARHQRECDDLIRLEERSSLKRPRSSETIRDNFINSAQSDTDYTSGNATDTTESVVSSPKRRRIDLRQNSIKASVMSARSSISARSSVVDPLDARWEFPMPATAPLSFPSEPGKPIAGPSNSRNSRDRHSTSGSSSSSVSLSPSSSSSSSQWVVLQTGDSD